MSRWLALLSAVVLGATVGLVTGTVLVLWGAVSLPTWYEYAAVAVSGIVGIVYGTHFYSEHRPRKPRPDLYVG